MERNKLRIVFMGTPEIASYVLEALLENNYNVVGVVAQPDKPIGRKQTLTPVPTKCVAQKYHIPTFQPTKIRLDFGFMNDLHPDLIITLAYGQILPQKVLEIPTKGCLNLHGSLLPKYRGAAPMQYALINGETVTGMTLMEMIDKMDAGKMYAKKSFEISSDETLSSLTEKMKVCAKELILESLPLFLEGKLNGEEQDESKVTFAPSIRKEEEHLNLNLTAQKACNWIRALNDHPGAYLILDNQKIKIWKAIFLNDKVEGKIGQIIKADKQGLWMQAKDGQLALLELQKEGKNKMDYRSFINGYPNLINKIFN